MTTPATRIEIDIPSQTLTLLGEGAPPVTYSVSTATNGAGEITDSECTPRGRLEVSEKIGAGCEPNTVFVGRRPTGEIYSPELGRANPERDWILTRILWLSGLEPGFNAGGERDTKSRYIYIHGTPDLTRLGVPGSRGCIRMRNDDVIALFERTAIGTPVTIRG